MKFHHFLAIVLLCGTSAVAQAGQARPGEPQPFGMHPVGIHAGKLVTGLPYSAEVNSLFVKTLVDGNRIQHTTTGKVARDSQGRTFTQETIQGLWGQGGSKTMTFISDPLAGYVYSLNAETKVATRRPLPSSASNQPRVEKPNVITVQLGTQLVNGLNTQGKRTTRTIAVGEMGNTQPIVSTSEIWFSPDLQVVISSKRIDPRVGTSTYALTNIQRTEPAAALFQVPSDYTIQDAPAFPK